MKKEYELIIESVAEKEGYLYCVGLEMSILFKVNLETIHVESILNLPDEDRLTPRLYNGIAIEDEKMILVPYNAQKLWIYDFVCGNWTGISMDKILDSEMGAKFVGGVLKEGKAYLFGYNYPGILVVDINTFEMFNLLEKEKLEKKAFWGKSIANVGDELYIPCRFNNEVVCINLKEATYKKIALNDIKTESEITNTAIAHDGKDFFIMPYNGNYFYKWELNGEVKKIEIDPVFDTKINSFNGIAVSESYVFLFAPKGKNYIYSRKEPNKSYVLEDRIYFSEYVDNVGFIVCRKGKINIYDETLELKKEINIIVNNEVYSEYISTCEIKKGRILKETATIGITEYLDILKGSKG